MFFFFFVPSRVKMLQFNDLELSFYCHEESIFKNIHVYTRINTGLHGFFK